MDEGNLTYKVFKDRETWLEAREETVGASSLAHFIASGELPSPPPDVPAVQSALQFGSIWEPMLVKLYAEHLHLDVASKNTPVANLTAGQLAWYDNSFYTDGRLHVSLDAAYRDHEGILHTVEVKTGSKPSYAFLTTEQRKQYSAQAQIEARMMDTEHAEIIYAQRPPIMGDAERRIHHQTNQGNTRNHNHSKRDGSGRTGKVCDSIRKCGTASRLRQ